MIAQPAWMLLLCVAALVVAWRVGSKLLRQRAYRRRIAVRLARAREDVLWDCSRVADAALARSINQARLTRERGEEIVADRALA